MKSIIENKLKAISGLKVEYIGRSSNLFWFGFGDLIRVPHGKKQFKEVAMYSLNIQCMWRLMDKKKILVANMDVYSPRSDAESIETFEWEEVGANLFDEKVQELTKSLRKIINVNEIKVTESGDIKLYFSNGWVLEVFIDASNNTECWRFFKSGDLESHLVLTGVGIE